MKLKSTNSKTILSKTRFLSKKFFTSKKSFLVERKKNGLPEHTVLHFGFSCSTVHAVIAVISKNDGRLKKHSAPKIPGFVLSQPFIRIDPSQSINGAHISPFIASTSPTFLCNNFLPLKTVPLMYTA